MLADRRPNVPTLISAIGLTVLMLASLYGLWVLRAWYIEDAAISFAFARNLGDGWGLVRYPGDERVEGYSNPLWVLLMAGAHVLGIDAFDSSKQLAAVLLPLTVVGVFLTLVRARVHYAFALAAAAVLATDASQVIWSASGLENALFGALLAIGLWRTIDEGERGGFPWAAVAFLGLAVTRPDGIAYAALGGFWALVLEAAGERRWRRIALWLLVFWVPFAVYHAIRYDYFAFLFPSTYYAKLDRAPYWWRDNSYGWRYLGDYAQATWRLWFFPVFLAGAMGLKGWRAPLVALFSLVFAVFVLFPGVEPLVSQEWWPKLQMPTWWSTAKVGWIFGLALFAPLFAIRTPHWQVRMIAWWMLQFGLFFVLISNGDWMRGFRWLSLVSVPAALLFGLGLRDLYTLAAAFRWPEVGAGAGIIAAGACLVGQVIPQVLYQRDYRPETTPFSVKKRVDHYRWVRDMLRLDKVDILDHDMGAMLWWAGDMGIVRDSKGLADIAFAYQKGEPTFVAEYAFEEYPFDLAHGHATTSQLMQRQRQRWTSGYVEFPGYGGGNKPHLANYFRKSLLVHPWEGSTDHTVTFQGGVKLHGLELPNSRFAFESGLHLEYAMSRSNTREMFDLLVFLFDDTGVKAVAGLPQGFERFYPVEEWLAGEVVHQQVGFKVPDHPPPPGAYRIGAVVIGPNGPLEPIEVGPGVSIPETPLFMRGEFHLELPLTAISAREAEERAVALYDAAQQEARAGRCAAAAKAWSDAKSQVTLRRSWREERYGTMNFALAGCHVMEAQAATTREATRDALAKAVHLDRTHPELLRMAPALTQPWYDEALVHLEAGENEEAHRLLVDVIKVDPSRSWARRKLEDLRRIRLDLK